ncbi:MAG: Rpn family recombination-promoting nuclease/putative transposase [Thermoguttaceae bacterium]
MNSKYINPYTDFGFKKLFGEEANKDLLIDFLNTLLPQRHQISTITFRNPDVLGESVEDRRAVFDIYCENAEHEPFIVEMQKAEQAHFKDRSVYYVAHPIREQAVKGKAWDYQQRAVYFIGILDFVYDKGTSEPILIREVSLKDQFGKEFYEKLQMIYVQMPLFKKTESELVTRQDKWLYFLKNLPDLNHIPAIMKEEVVFEKAFHTAEVAAMTEREREAYEQALNDYWTYLATLDFAAQTALKRGLKAGRKEGLEKGLKEGLAKGLKEGQEKGLKEGLEKGRTESSLEIARNLKAIGLDVESIAKATGLSVTEVKTLE